MPVAWSLLDKPRFTDASVTQNYGTCESLSKKQANSWFRTNIKKGNRKQTKKTINKAVTTGVAGSVVFSAQWLWRQWPHPLDGPGPALTTWRKWWFQTNWPEATNSSLFGPGWLVCWLLCTWGKSQQTQLFVAWYLFVGSICGSGWLTAFLVGCINIATTPSLRLTKWPTISRTTSSHM